MAGPGVNKGLYPIPRIWNRPGPLLPITRSTKAAFPKPTETNICFKILLSLSRNARATTHGTGDGVGTPTLTTFNRAVCPEASPTIPELNWTDGSREATGPCAPVRCAKHKVPATTVSRILNAQSLRTKTLRILILSSSDRRSASAKDRKPCRWEQCVTRDTPRLMLSLKQKLTYSVFVFVRRSVAESIHRT